MKTLIAYASKTGTAAVCARRLAAQLDDAVLVDLSKEQPAVAEYDQIVVGGSIRMGKLHKAARIFIERNEAELLAKPSAFFICNGFIEQADDIIAKNFSSPLRQRALTITSFGGELAVEKQKGMDKMIVKAVQKSEQGKAAQPRILDDRIAAFAALLK